MSKPDSRSTRLSTFLLAVVLTVGVATPGMAWLAPPEQYHVEEGWGDPDEQTLTQEEPSKDEVSPRATNDARRESLIEVLESIWQQIARKLTP